LAKIGEEIIFYSYNIKSNKRKKMTLIKKLESIFHMMEDITDDEIDSLDSKFYNEFIGFMDKLKLKIEETDN
tara:strand:+ start:2014 stop:2229 length:216 start_codon:yes stop_codon:yes gene_type:complete